MAAKTKTSWTNDDSSDDGDEEVVNETPRATRPTTHIPTPENQQHQQVDTGRRLAKDAHSTSRDAGRDRGDQRYYKGEARVEGRGDSRSDTRSGALGLGDARDTHKERPPLVSRGGDRHEGRGGRGGRTGGLDDQGRHGSYSGRQDSAQKSSREVSVPTPARPKLNLMPRSIPLDQVAAPIGDPTIFGVGKARVALEDTVAIDSGMDNLALQVETIGSNDAEPVIALAAPIITANTAAVHKKQQSSSSHIASERNGKGSEGKGKTGKEKKARDKKPRKEDKLVEESLPQDDIKGQDNEGTFQKASQKQRIGTNRPISAAIIPPKSAPLKSNPFGALEDSDEEEEEDD